VRLVEMPHRRHGEEGVARRRLAGDQIAEAVRRADASELAGPAGDRARSGGTDPESLAEFLAYDIPFRTEPAVNIIFPPEAQPEEPSRG
jgi:hypothetical protein